MPMRCAPVSVLIPLFFFIPQFILSIAVNLPTPYSPIDNLAINCGSSGNLITHDGREWIGDIGSGFSQLELRKSKSVTSKAFRQFSDAVHHVPYMTARISRSQFSYTFQACPGQKFIRLHFHPVSYPGFERSSAIFTVKAGQYTLLSNFSAPLTADALRLRSFVKEFCLNVGESRALTISFFPSPSSPSDAAYAFINGIEIVSMPTGLYYTQGNDPGAFVVGQTYRFYIENSTALEMIQRFNVGGSSIPSVEDSGMFREWPEDSSHLMESTVVPISTTVPIKYTSIPTCIAPPKVYQTTWSVGPNKQPGQLNNFTWKLPVDLGFRYLIRLHFCELEYAIKDSGQREFCIIINEQIAEACADIIKWSGGIGVAIYKDYVVKMEGDRMEGKQDLIIAIQPHCPGRRSKHAIDPILNGVEVFKLSNLDNNLAGPNPEFLADNKTSKEPMLGKVLLICEGVKVIVNRVIIVITLLNIIVHQLCMWAENSGKKTISKSSRKEISRRFSLAEIHFATNNFDDAFIIGCGGFGKVYKGIINEGTTIVAIKRLNSSSKQGAHEFWTEIDTLSELRHTHLVTLIGYCDDCQEMILVYEYMAHGTLADHIYKNRRKADGISSLTWEERLSICIGAARGLNYLHVGTNLRVIHRDVKSTNILLDENWVAKMSDFGLSKMGNTNQSGSHVSTNVKGTFGYLDPEYYSTHRLTRKSDVYAFGVVLLEVLCGRPAVDMKLEEEQHSLALWAQRCIRGGIIHQLIDPHLKTQMSSYCLKVFVEVALKCLHNYSKDRPTMEDVVGSLELALAAQKSYCKEISRRFSLAEIHFATNNFDDAFIIGCGGFGKVYKGIINEGTTIVAIKRLNSSSKQGAHEFWTEIDTLSELRHTHLVTLIGYCDDCQEMILVYEYMAHGTLADHIYKNRRKADGISSLTWEERLSICIGAARGLNYLHEGTNLRVIHRDVKSTNILLDENWVAKMSDFGLSKMGNTNQSGSHVSTNVKGTFGYLDPEYYSTHRLTRKSDVYAFGVVLLEVLCGRPAVDMKLEEEQHSLALWAQRCIRGGIIHQLIDPHLKTQMSPYCLKVFVEVAMKCLHNYSKDRPTMEDVVGSLELALAAQKSSSSWTEKEAISINGGADDEQIVCALNNEPLSVKRPKPTITKLVQSMVVTAKGKDLQRKKPKDHGSDSSAGGSSWWWPWKPSTNSTKKPNGRRLPPLLEDLCRHFSLAEIQAATNNFDCNLIIRHASIGELYKGYIDNGSLVVVIRRLKPGSHLARQCWDKVEILAELHHINLLSPIGYCSNGGEMILVYDYLGNGSLHDHLFGMHNDPLPWKRRLEICIGIGQGLQYLHAGTRHTVIHCDIKSANVLLDHNWVPKFSFLKSSILLEPSSMATAEIIGGTFGYEAPECIKVPVTEKIDVYSLGIVLLQVLSGLDVSGTNWTSVDYFRSCVNRKCVDPTVLQYRHLVSYFRGCIDRKCIVHIIDPYLIGKIPPECFWVYVKVLWSCLQYQGFKRPSMDDVVRRLQLALQLLETSGDTIRFGGESEVDKTDMSYKEVVAQAYNDALFSDSKPFFIDSDCFAPSSSQLRRASRVPVNLCKKHFDYCPCNLSR